MFSPLQPFSSFFFVSYTLVAKVIFVMKRRASLACALTRVLTLQRVGKLQSALKFVIIVRVPYVMAELIIIAPHTFPIISNVTRVVVGPLARAKTHAVVFCAFLRACYRSVTTVLAAVRAAELVMAEEIKRSLFMLKTVIQISFESVYDQNLN